MESFFEPDPVLLVFIGIKKFAWFEVLALLAILRLCVGPKWRHRGAASLSLAVCLLGIYAVFAPALAMNDGVFYARLGQAMALWGGMAMALAASIGLLISAGPEARWRWIDALHLLGLAGLLGLWWWSS